MSFFASAKNAAKTLATRQNSYEDYFGQNWDGQKRGGEVVALREGGVWRVVSDHVIVVDIDLFGGRSVNRATIYQTAFQWRIKDGGNWKIPSESVDNITLDGIVYHVCNIPCSILVTLNGVLTPILGVLGNADTGDGVLLGLKDDDPFIKAYELSERSIDDIGYQLTSSIMPTYAHTPPPKSTSLEEANVKAEEMLSLMQDVLKDKDVGTRLSTKAYVMFDVCYTMFRDELLSDKVEFARKFRKVLDKVASKDASAQARSEEAVDEAEILERKHNEAFDKQRMEALKRQEEQENKFVGVRFDTINGKRVLNLSHLNKDLGVTSVTKKSKTVEAMSTSSVGIVPESPAYAPSSPSYSPPDEEEFTKQDDAD